MTFGQKLKLLLKDSRMSQEDLAEQLNVSRQAAGKWVNDKGMPEVGKLIQISEIFGVSLDYLLKDEYEKAPEEPRGKTLLPNSGYYVSQEMLDGYLSCSRQNILQLTVGISLLVLSDLFDYPGYHNFLTSLLYWTAMTAGISLVIWYFSKPRQYQEIRTGPLIFDDSVFREFRQRRDTRRRHYAVMIIAGVVILLASSELELDLLAHFEPAVCNIFSTLADAVWLSLIIWAGMSMYTDSLIIRNASQSPENPPARRYRWIYAALPVTACSAMIGLATNAWSPYAPILILFCCLLAAACRLLLERRDEDA